MKTLLTSVLLLVSTFAFAEEVKLKKGDFAVDFAQSAKIVAVKNLVPRCPPSASCFPTTEVQIRVQLTGCVDNLGPVTHTLSTDEDGITTIKLAAINIRNKASATARCIQSPMANTSVMLRGIRSEKSVRLEVLK